MPDDDLDPAASTQMFRAFVEREQTDRAEETGSNRLLLIGLLAAVLAAVVIAVLLR